MAQVEALTPLNPAETMPFVGEVLGRLRQSVGNEAAVLGFVGAPWTLAAYVVEGKSSKNYAVIKAMAFREPQILHKLLDHFAESIANYLRYQIDSGAQVVQMFDSWAGQLSPADYDTFAAPYQKKVVDLVKQTHPDTPFILYISGSAGVIERMANTGVDIVSLDWTVDMAEALARMPEHIGVQGNVDPGLLFGSQDAIRDRIDDCVRKARGRKHILNLGTASSRAPLKRTVSSSSKPVSPSWIASEPRFEFRTCTDPDHGASGCVGQHIADLLYQETDAELLLWLRDPSKLTAVPAADPRITLLVGDLRDGAPPRSDRFGDADHPTATAWGDPERAQQVNVVAVKQMLAAPIPRCSSRWCISPPPASSTRTCSYCRRPCPGTEYIQTKAQCLEQLEQHPLAQRIVAVFPTLVFGGRVDGSGVFPQLSHSWSQGGLAGSGSRNGSVRRPTSTSSMPLISPGSAPIWRRVRINPIPRLAKVLCVAWSWGNPP